MAKSCHYRIVFVASNYTERIFFSLCWMRRLSKLPSLFRSVQCERESHYNFSARMFVFNFNFHKFSNQHIFSYYCYWLSRFVIKRITISNSCNFFFLQSERYGVPVISQVVDCVVWCCCWKVAIKLKHKRQFSYLFFYTFLDFFFNFKLECCFCARIKWFCNIINKVFRSFWIRKFLRFSHGDLFRMS